MILPRTFFAKTLELSLAEDEDRQNNSHNAPYNILGTNMSIDSAFLMNFPWRKGQNVDELKMYIGRFAKSARWKGEFFYLL